MPDPEARRVKFVVPLLILALSAIELNAQVFKWVDEKGRTHYGEKPPEGVKSSEVAKPTPPSEPARTAPADSWKAKLQESQRQKAEKHKAEIEAGATEEHIAAERDRRCRNARITLDRLENVQRLYRYNDKGEREYYTDAERATERTRAQREAQEHCPSR